MKFSLYFSKVKIDFDPTVHFQEDSFIFAIEIVEEEGKAAQAFLTFQNLYEQEDSTPWSMALKEGHYVYISVQEEGKSTASAQLLFIGRLLAVPKEVTEEFIIVRATALPEDASYQEQDILRILKEQDVYDVLFENMPVEGSLKSILEKTPFVLHWDRLSHKASLAHCITGIHRKRLSKDVFKKEVTASLKAVPVHTLVVQMEVEWVQHAVGIVDIYPQIAKHFESGQVNTLTGPDFLKQWWKTGDSLGYVGYRIIRSSLKPISVEGTALPKRHIVLLKEKDPMALRHFWFRGELFLKWEYRQKRQENLKFFIETFSQEKRIEEGSEETIFMRLGNIVADGHTIPWKEGVSYKIGDEVFHGEYVYACTQPHIAQSSFYIDTEKWLQKSFGRGELPDFRVSSFFLTQRGRRAFEHALYWAKSYLMRKARCREITFEGHIKDLAHLSTADSLEIEDPCLPKGRAIGKISTYHLKVDAREATEKVIVKLAAVKEEESGSRKLDIREGICVSPEGISYGSFEEQKPLYGILNPQELQASDIVKYVLIHHPSTSQKKALGAVEFSMEEDVETYLSQYRTALTIHLQEMRQNIPLLHQIQVPWVEPVCILS